MSGRVSPSVNPKFLWVRFGRTKSVKAGWFYLYPPLEASPLLAFFYSYDMRGLPLVVRPSMCFVVFVFHLLEHIHSRLFDSFCIADLNTLGASTVPSPRCEAPPEQGHKVLEAGTDYP